MCGIVGYVGVKNASPILIEALKKLEYRGYDSAGIAVLNNDELLVRKAKGALKFLQEKIAKEIIRGSCGIGHTRWATHGEPSDENSHPHTDVSGSIAVVHNGIIENYSILKQKLQGKGITFKSETDTEVIAHLIAREYGKLKSLPKAVRSAIKLLKGAYAICVIHKDEPNMLVVARKRYLCLIFSNDYLLFLINRRKTVVKIAIRTMFDSKVHIPHSTWMSLRCFVYDTHSSIDHQFHR